MLGSRKVGKTALVHYMTNMSSFGNQYNVRNAPLSFSAVSLISCRQPTKNLELRHIKLDHPDEAVGQCSIAELGCHPPSRAADIVVRAWTSRV